jgi:hypothetical protein
MRFFSSQEYALNHEQGYQDILNAVEKTVKSLLEEGLHETIV